MAALSAAIKDSSAAESVALGPSSALAGTEASIDDAPDPPHPLSAAADRERATSMRAPT